MLHPTKPAPHPRRCRFSAAVGAWWLSGFGDLLVSLSRQPAKLGDVGLRALGFALLPQ